MGRVAVAAALGAVLASTGVAATPSRLFPRHAPKETRTANIEVGGLFGWSPLPTQAPMGPPAVDLSLEKRYDKSSDTCGFAEGFKSDPWTCFAIGASCTVWSDYIGCCATTGDCSKTVLTACVDWDAVQSGECSGADAHTLCCTNSYPSCWTWTSTTSTDPDKTMTGFNCLASGGTGALFEQPPELTMTSATGSDDPDTSGTADATSNTREINPTDAPGSSNNGDDNDDPNGSSSGSSGSGSGSSKSGGTNVGAIVGGVVGGFALVALSVLAVGIMFWRKRKANNANGVPSQNTQPYNNGSAPPQMGAVVPPPSAAGTPYANNGVASGYYPPPAPGSYDPSKTPGSMYSGATMPSNTGNWVGQHSTGSSGPSTGPNAMYPQPTGPQELATTNPAESKFGSTEHRAELS